MCNQPPICQNHPTVRYIEYHTRCPPDACYFEFLMDSVRQSTVTSLVMYIPVKIQKTKTRTRTKFPVYKEHCNLESCFQVNDRESRRRSVAPNDEIPLSVLKIHFTKSYKCILSGALKFESVRSAYEGDNFRGPKFYVSFFFMKNRQTWAAIM